MIIKVNSVYTDDILESKRIKIKPFLYEKADIYIWIDSNIKLLVDKEQLVDEFLGGSDIGLFKHPERNTIEEELGAIQIHRNKHYEKVRWQVLDYINKYNFRDNKGLYECGVLIIRDNKKTKKFCEDWWEQIKKYSVRDQISFPYILSKHNINIKANNGDVRKHKWFKFQ